MKTVTFITTGQPTTNPRLVKEATLLAGLGYRVNVIYCFYQQWAKGFDEQIIAANPGMYIICGGDPITDKLNYYKTRVRQKLNTGLSKISLSFGIAENSISRTHAEAVKLAKKLKADIYIAHNLGALPAAVIAAKFHQAKVGYDAEDMHSGQFTSTSDTLYKINKHIEEKYFKQTDYFTAASPLIAREYKKAYPFLSPVVLNNAFPKTTFTSSFVKQSDEPLKLFWFSQTIGPNRGLETIIAAMGRLSNPIQLHLLGSVAQTDRDDLMDLASTNGLKAHQLQFHAPVGADEVLTMAATFDIGMASETGDTLNRDICLTNKIFTYVQCGLAVIANDTQAQSQFLQEYPDSGLLYHQNDAASLAAAINRYISNPNDLQKTRSNNYNLGQTKLNWEKESAIFLNTLHATLN